MALKVLTIALLAAAVAWAVAVTPSENAAIREIITEHDTRYAQRFDAQAAEIKALAANVNQRFDAQKDAVAAALAAQKELASAAMIAASLAVTKAETATEKRFEQTNEYRAQLTHQESTYLTRAEFYWAVGLLLTLTGMVAAGAAFLLRRKAEEAVKTK